MRFLLKVQMPVEAGNTAIRDGSLPKVIESTLAKLKPEAAYFFADDGKRTMMLFFNLNDTSEIPVIMEPLFMGVNASVELIPVMNVDELKAGLEKASKHF